jgi:hypothetical protein
MNELSKTIGLAGLLGTFVIAACVATEPGAPASAAAAKQQQCFNVRNVYNFHAVNDRTVLVEVGTSRMYELQIVGVCPEIDWTQKLAIRTTGGSSWICRGMDAELVVPSPSGTERCPVVGTRELTPAEVQAYRASRKH